MAAFNVSLDDSSPLISYSPSGAWTDTTKGDETLAQSYALQSFHTAAQSGATASFTFNGTGVWLYGGARSNYGSYSVQVDGNTIIRGSAATNVSSSTNIVNLNMLGGVGDLSMGQHSVVLTNLGGGPIDIDSLTFQTEVGLPGQTLSTALSDDTSENFFYSVSPVWQVEAGGSFFNNSIHYSQQNGAQASFNFLGNAVEIIGGSSFDHGDYTVEVDGQPSTFNGGGNGLAREYHAKTVLFFVNNLGPEQHTLTILNTGQGNTTFLDIDGIVVYSATGAPSSNSTSGAIGQPTSSASASGQPSSTASSNPSGANDSSGSSTSKGLSQGAAAAIAVIIILLILGLAAGYFFFYVRRRPRNADEEQGPPPPDETPSPILPIQDPILEEAKEFYNYGPNSAFVGQKDVLASAALDLPVLNYYPTEEDIGAADLTPTNYPSRGESRTYGHDLNEDDELQRSQLNRNHTTHTRWSQASYESAESEITIQSSDQVVLQPESDLPTTPKAAVTRPRASVAPSQMGSPKDDIDDITGYYLHLRDTMMTVGPAPLRISRPVSYARDGDDEEFHQVQL